MNPLVLCLVASVACWTPGANLKLETKLKVKTFTDRQVLVAHGPSDPYGPDPHGKDPHGPPSDDDPHDEEHDPHMRANEDHDKYRASRDVYGDTANNHHSPYPD